MKDFEIIRRSRQRLGNPYAYLDDSGQFSAAIGDPLGNPSPPPINASLLLAGKSKGGTFSEQDVERIVTRLLREIWRKRESLCGSTGVTPFEVLDPLAALNHLGYRATVEETLGQFSSGDGRHEVAGIIDEDAREVSISRRCPFEVRRFTAAHELGHAVLHRAQGLHRDRPVDGSHAKPALERVEIEANRFAVCFLMPAKLVRAEFLQRFLTERFGLNDHTAFALSSTSLAEVSSQFESTRALARHLATTDYYNGTRFTPLVQRFGVSRETMAIRFEELGLIAEMNC